MYSMFADPNLATQIAKQRVDEWVRDAQARRTAREVRRAARAHRTATAIPAALPEQAPRPHEPSPVNGT
jgi:hypothetical protein